MYFLEDEEKDRIIEYVIKKADDLEFTHYFWRDCEPLEYDLRQYRTFVHVIQEGFGVVPIQIPHEVKVSGTTVRAWTNLERTPKLVQYLLAFVRQGLPNSGFVWLTMETSHGHAAPVGFFVQVPKVIHGWRDVELVLDQLQPLEEPLQFHRRYLMGFFFGMVIGDGAKSKQGRGHRHIGLALSKRYDTNLLVGEFTCACARNMGLRMHRIKDREPKSKPNGFYEWVSQASPFLDWMFNVALGLDDGSTTTYDPVHADWILEAPREFRVGLLQGLAESDGSVSIASQTAELWVDPQRGLVQQVLAKEGIRSFFNREALSMTKSQAIKSFDIPLFSPELKTVRYRRLEIVAKTRRLTRLERLSPELRAEIIQLGREKMSVPKIVEKIAETRGVLVSFEAAQRWARKGLVARANANR